MKKIAIVIIVSLVGIFIWRTFAIVEIPIVDTKENKQITEDILKKFEKIDNDIKMSKEIKTEAIPITPKEEEKKYTPEKKEERKADTGVEECKEGKNIIFDWIYSDRTTTICIPQLEYDYYASLNHGRQGAHMVTANNIIIQRLAGELKTQEDIRSFVYQNIEYINDQKKYGYEYPQYPIETLWNRSGDCEDMSYLLSSLLQAQGYDTVLFVFKGDGWGHMAVGIAGDYDGFFVEDSGKKYYYLESIRYREIGSAPEKYKNAKEIKVYK